MAVGADERLEGDLEVKVLFPEAHDVRRRRRRAIGTCLLVVAISIAATAVGLRLSGATGIGSTPGGRSPGPAILGPAIPLSSEVSSNTPLYLPFVSCAGAGSCIALGAREASGALNSTNLIERISGTTWRTAWLMPQDVNATGLSCPTIRWCVIVATPGSGIFPRSPAYVALWASGRFATMQTPTLKFGGSLAAVSCSSTRWCVAVGGFGTAPLVERWNGVSWSVMRQPLELQGAIPNAVSCTSQRFCIAVGLQGALGPFAEVWNGSKWTVTPNPLRTYPEPITNGSERTVPESSLTEVSCVSRVYCVATGELVGRAQLWNGQSWVFLSPPGTYGGPVSCTGDGSCTLISTASNASSARFVQRFANGRWTTIGSSGLSASLYNVSCTSRNVCHVVGADWPSATAASWDGRAWSADHFARSTRTLLLGAPEQMPSESRCAGSPSATVVSITAMRRNPNVVKDVCLIVREGQRVRVINDTGASVSAHLDPVYSAQIPAGGAFTFSPSPSSRLQPGVFPFFIVGTDGQMTIDLWVDPVCTDAATNAGCRTPSGAS